MPGRHSFVGGPEENIHIVDNGIYIKAGNSVHDVLRFFFLSVEDNRSRLWEKTYIALYHQIGTPLLLRTLIPALRVKPAHCPIDAMVPPTDWTSSSLLSRNFLVSKKEGDVSLVMNSSLEL